MVDTVSAGEQVSLSLPLYPGSRNAADRASLRFTFRAAKGFLYAEKLHTAREVPDADIDDYAIVDRFVAFGGHEPVNGILLGPSVLAHTYYGGDEAFVDTYQAKYGSIRMESVIGRHLARFAIHMPTTREYVALPELIVSKGAIPPLPETQ